MKLGREDHIAEGDGLMVGVAAFCNDLSTWRGRLDAVAMRLQSEQCGGAAKCVALIDAIYIRQLEKSGG